MKVKVKTLLKSKQDFIQVKKKALCFSKLGQFPRPNVV